MLQMTQPVLRPFQRGPEGSHHPHLCIFQGLLYLLQVGNSHLCRCCGRCRSGVGHMISHGHVCLMAHRGDHRHIAGEYGPGHHLRVKAPEVLGRAATPANYDQIRAAPQGQEGGGNALLRLLPLHLGGREYDPGGIISQRAQHIPQSRPLGRGDYSYPLRIAGQGPLSLRGE